MRRLRPFWSKTRLLRSPDSLGNTKTFQLLSSLDLDEALMVINTMPKLY